VAQNTLAEIAYLNVKEELADAVVCKKLSDSRFAWSKMYLEQSNIPLAEFNKIMIAIQTPAGTGLYLLRRN
jgi:hypothetical protein